MGAKCDVGLDIGPIVQGVLDTTSEDERRSVAKGAVMRRKLAIAFISVVVLAGASTFLNACNTVEGAGRDVSKAGMAITDEAKKDKHY